MIFPAKTQLNKILPKAKFMKFAKLSTAARNELASNTERLILANILRKDTVNAAAGKDVQEINVFEIYLKEKKFSDNLIKEIDSVLPKHVLYILKYGNLAQLAISFKEKTLKNTYRVLKVYRTNWMNVEDLALEVSGLNLDCIFNNFISQISNKETVMADNLSMAQAVKASVEIEKLERKIKQLENKIRKEPQFNKQLELKNELKELRLTKMRYKNG